MKILQRVEHLTTVCGDIAYLAVQVLDQETGKTEEYILESQKAFTYSGPLFKDINNHHLNAYAL